MLDLQYSSCSTEKRSTAGLTVSGFMCAIFSGRRGGVWDADGVLLETVDEVGDKLSHLQEHEVFEVAVNEV